MEFTNPWFMAAGGALVAAPILIHLINRMRFKRIRWAAMEFLLKSQKRNRRKLIIEQLILLALRCLLVMLAGFLLGRLRLGRDTGQNAFHYVVLDDTFSMGDRFVDAGKATHSFEIAKQEIKDLAAVLSNAQNGQRLRVAMLSDLDGKPIFDAQIDTHSLRDLGPALDAATEKLAYQHISPLKALKSAQKVFADEMEQDARQKRPTGKRYFHFVSDYRKGDWKEDADESRKAVDDIVKSGAYVSLIDVANPYRDANGQLSESHDNLAIEDLRSDSSIAIDGAAVEFTVGVFNHSDKPKNTSLRVFTRSICVNDLNQLDKERDFKLETDVAAQTDALPPNKLTEHKFRLVLKKKQNPLDAKDDKPDVRMRKRLADAEFVQVRVQIEDNPSEVGLALDNVRDTIVALQRSVPVLVLDGDPDHSRKVSGDLWYLRRALESSLSYRMERCGSEEEFDATPLDRYPDVFLVNVAQLKDETIQKLADYVAKGGGLAYFVGDQTRPDLFNRIFYNKDKPAEENSKPFYDSPNGEPLFPVLLDKEPSKPMSEKEAEDRLVNDKQPKILFPDEDHPIIRGRAAAPGDKGGLVKVEDRLRFLTIRRYWPCQPRALWSSDQTQEVAVLPNHNALDAYKPTAQGFMDAAMKQTAQLAGDDKKFQPYVDRLAAEQKSLLAAIAPGKSYLDDLITVMDELMNDPGVKDDSTRPNMTELWVQPSMRSLKDQIDAFRKTLKYGDPLVVTRPFGKGRVLAFLTTAGTLPRGVGDDAISWNDWAGSPIAGSYPVFIKQMQDYLISTSEQRTLPVGTDVALPELEATVYQPQIQMYFLGQTPLAKGGPEERPQLLLQPTTLTMQPTGPNGSVYRHVEDGKEFSEPGVYVFTFTPDPRAQAQPPNMVLQAYAFNVDATMESDLTRAPKETLEKLMPNLSTGAAAASGSQVALRGHGQAYEDFKERPPDMSDMIWIFLLLGLVFVVEQALAVHLSFHLKEGEALAAPAPRQPAAA